MFKSKLSSHFLASSSLVLGISLTLSGLANAQSLGSIAYGGSGCPNGSAQQSFDSADGSVILTLSSMVANANSDTGRNVDRKSCNLAIPIDVPPGMSVALVTSTTGTYDVGVNGTAKYSQELFTTGSRGPLIQKEFIGPVSDVLNVDSASEVDPIWTPCGQSTILRTNISMTALTSAFATVDQVRFKLIFRQCNYFGLLE